MCAVIWAVEHSGSLGTVLGAWPLAALGRISYGFYLWHWPIILWLRPPENADWSDRRLVNAAQFGVTLAVATASYVSSNGRSEWESCRRRESSASPARPSQWSASSSPRPSCSRSTTGYAAYAASALDDPSVEHCPNVPRPCVKYEPGDPNAPTVVTIGDSTAQSYDPAMKALAEQYGFRYVQAAVGGCPIGVRLVATGLDGERHKPSNFECYDNLDSIYAEVLETWNPELFIATSFNETNQHVTDGDIVPVGTPEHLPRRAQRSRPSSTR